MRQCAYCGEGFEGGPASKRFCSSRCRQMAFWTRKMGTGVEVPQRAVKRTPETNGHRVLGYVVQDPATGQMRTVKVDG